jgi:outer membrane biosynthesis protein TonB
MKIPIFLLALVAFAANPAHGAAVSGITKRQGCPFKQPQPTTQAAAPIPTAPPPCPKKPAPPSQHSEPPPCPSKPAPVPSAPEAPKAPGDVPAAQYPQAFSNCAKAVLFETGINEQDSSKRTKEYVLVMVNPSNGGDRVVHEILGKYMRYDDEGALEWIDPNNQSSSG